MAKLMSALLAIWVSSGFVARGGSPAQPTNWSSGISAFCVDPVSNTTLYAGTGSFSGQGVGVLKSADGGATWTRLISGLTDKDIDAIAVDPENPLNIYVGTPAGQGLYKSTDGGQTFKRCNKGAEAEMSSNGVFNIVIDPTNSQVVYAEAGVAGLGGEDPEAWAIYKSTNGGGSWTSIYSVTSYGYDFTDPGFLAVDPKNSQNLYVAARWLDEDIRPDMLKSTDGGRSWKKIANIAVQDVDICASLVVDPKRSSRLFCSWSMSGAFRSTNSGKTWIKMPIPSNAVGNIVLSPSSPNVLYIST